MTRHLRLAWSIVVAAGLILPGQVAAGGPPSSRATGRGAVPDARITGFHLVETKSGMKLWEIWGDLAEVFEKEGLAKVMKVSRQVTVALYSDQGTLTTRSDKATINMRSKDVRLDGNVTATTEQGSSLHTEVLDWLADTRRLFTRLPVTLTKGGLVSRGVGMEAETDLERVRLLSRVESHVIPGNAGVRTKGLPVLRKGATR